MFKFIHEDKEAGTLVEHTNEDVTLFEILPQFEQFLRGCGFTIDGVLEVVSEETLGEATGDDQN